MVFYCFSVQWTVRAGAILGTDEGGGCLGWIFFKEKKMQESLSFAGEVQTHAVSLLAV